MYTRDGAITNTHAEGWLYLANVIGLASLVAGWVVAEARCAAEVDAIEAPGRGVR